jgi:hypothetical protein
MADKKAGKWFEVVEYGGESQQTIDLPTGERFAVRGPIHDLMVVSVPNEMIPQLSTKGSAQAMLEGLQMAIRGGGFEGGIVLCPEHVKFMRLRPVDWGTARLLEQRDRREVADRKARLAQMEAEQDAEREGPELTAQTETVGEA